MFTVKCIRQSLHDGHSNERVFSADNYEVIEYANGLKFIELYNAEETVTKHLTISNGLLMAATDYHVDTHYHTAFITNENGKTVSTVRSFNQGDAMIDIFHKMFHGVMPSMLVSRFRAEISNISHFTGWLVPLDEVVNKYEGIDFYSRLLTLTRLSLDDARALWFSGWKVEMEKGWTPSKDGAKPDMEYILRIGCTNKFDLGPAANVADVYESCYQAIMEIPEFKKK